MSGDRLHSLITDFTSGELSPRWQARVAGGTVATPYGTSAPMANIYLSGCKEMTNMLPLPQGGAFKRLGTSFGAYTDDNFNDVMAEGTLYRLTTFRVGDIDVLLLWRHLELRIYATSVPTVTLLQTLATPYTLTDLAGLAFTQSRNEMVVMHEDFRPRLLHTVGFVFELIDSVDRLVPPQFDFGDDIAQGTTPVAIARSYTLVTTLTVDERMLDIDVSYTGNEQRAQIKKDNDAKTAGNIKKALGRIGSVKADTISVLVDGVNTFAIEYEYWGSVGDLTGEMSLEFREQDSTKADFELTDETDNDAGQATTEPLWSGPFYMLHNAVYYRCDVSHRSATDNEPGVGADWADYWTAAGAVAPTEDVDMDDAWVLNTAYYPRDRGWPSLGTFHEQRLVLNGPVSVPHAVAAGRLTQTEYLDFKQGINADDGILFLVANEKGVKVNWFLSQRKLFIGTTQGVYIQTEVPFTPTSVSLERHSMNRAGRLNALAVNGELLYAQGNFRQVRKIQYVNDVDMWEGRDMTLFAEHLFKPDQKIADWSYGNEVDSVIWAVRQDGLLMSMTYEANYSVSAWAKHNVNAPVLRVETAYEGDKELTVLLVQRLQWDAATQTERVRPTLEIIEATSANDYTVEPDFSVLGDSAVPAGNLPPTNWTVHVDAYEVFTGDGTNTISIPRLARQLVSVVENGVVLATQRVAQDGTLTLDADTQVGSTVYVGHPFNGRLVPNRIQFATMDGVSQSQKIRWTKPVLRLFASTLPKINGERASERNVAGSYDTAPSLTTGDVDIVNLGSDTGLVIDADQPLPCHITGIFGLLTTEGG